MGIKTSSLRLGWEVQPRRVKVILSGNKSEACTMTTFFQAHLGDEEGVCSDHRNLQTTQPPHQLSGTPGARLVRAPENSILEICFVSFRVCMVSFVCVCLWRCLFVCVASLVGRLVAAVLPSACSG